MSRILILLLSAVLYLTACGKDAPSPEVPAAPPEPPAVAAAPEPADVQPEPDYVLYISEEPIPTVDGCLVMDRLPVRLINNTGEDGQVLLIPHLERRNEAGEWEEVPYKEGVGFCGTADPLPAEGKEWSEDLLYLWGGLEDGRYRLSYEVGRASPKEGRAYGEFTLYTPEAGGLPLAPAE